MAIKDSTLRIAFVHSFYSSKQPSGENFVVESEVKALRKAGHEVELFAAHTDDAEGDLLYPLRAAYRVATGRGRNPLDAIRRFRPDIVHVHNLFPNFSRKWVEDVDVPLVHTLHNYRPMCANGLLFRDGRICTDCPDGRRWSGVRHGCYRGSRLATLPASWAGRKGFIADPLLKRADRILALSQKQRDVYLAFGASPDRISVAPNFLPDHLDTITDGAVLPTIWLYVGRLAPEKGIVPLLNCWPEGHRLSLLGSGPLQKEIAKLVADRRHVTLDSRASRSRVVQLMTKAVGLVIPSLWLEAMPLVYIEALSRGVPVLAAAGNAASEAVSAHGTGRSFQWTEPMVAHLAEIHRQGSQLRERCRWIFESEYSERIWVERRLDLYRVPQSV